MRLKSRSAATLTRRQLLALGATAGAGVLLGGCDTGATSVPRKPVDTNALVIGSGFGGAVTALRLTQAGIGVTILERGRRWPLSPAGDTFSPTIPKGIPDKRAMWLRTETGLPLGPIMPIDKYIGVLEKSDEDGLSVYAGAGWGGGSLVYGCMSVQPSKSVFAQVFPAALSWDELDAVWYPKARKMLGVSEVPEDLYASDWYQFSRVFEQQAKAAGLSTARVGLACDWQVIREELAGTRKASALAGELIFGANGGYKNSVDRNYLAQAEATGRLTVHTQHLVTDLERDGDRWLVHIDVIDEQGQAVSKKTMTARNLFLAAGSLATSKLLVRAHAKGTIPGLEHAGEGVGTNGNVMFMRENLGVQSGSKSAVVPIVGITAFSEGVAPLLVESAPYPSGFDCACLLHLACVLSTGRGTVQHDKATDLTRLVYPKGASADAVAAVHELAGRLNKANGGTLAKVFTDTDADATTGFTYHPLGGAVMGKTCDIEGRVKGQQGLFVMDGALIPGSTACSNPSLTITALAERNIERILAAGFIA